MTDSFKFTPRSRRGFLAGVTSAGMVGLAGCSIFDSGDSPGDNQNSSQTDPSDPSGGNGNSSVPDNVWGGAEPTGGNQDSSVPAQSLRDGKSEGLPTPVLANPDSDVWVSSFTEFQCPYCAQYMLSVFPNLLEEYIAKGEINYEMFDMPFENNAEAWRASNAARAIQDTVGVGAYYKFSSAMFKRLYNNQSLGLSDYGELATKFDVDAETVRNAAKQGTYDTTIEADRQIASEHGVRGTPTIFVNGEKLDSWGFETIKSAIEDAR